MLRIHPERSESENQSVTTKISNDAHSKKSVSFMEEPTMHSTHNSRYKSPIIIQPLILRLRQLYNKPFTSSKIEDVEKLKPVDEVVKVFEKSPKSKRSPASNRRSHSETGFQKHNKVNILNSSLTNSKNQPSQDLEDYTINKYSDSHEKSLNYKLVKINKKDNNHNNSSNNNQDHNVNTKKSYLRATNSVSVLNTTLITSTDKMYESAMSDEKSHNNGKYSKASKLFKSIIIRIR